jgi:hypothetical protein
VFPPKAELSAVRIVLPLPICLMVALPDQIVEGKGVRTVEGERCLIRDIADDAAARVTIADLQGASPDISFHCGIAWYAG